MSSSQPTVHIVHTCEVCHKDFSPLKPEHRVCPTCYRANRPAVIWRTITSKYDGKCKRCGGTFAAGEKIRYGGKGLTYHLGECPSSSQPMPVQADEDICMYCNQPVERCECE